MIYFLMTICRWQDLQHEAITLEAALVRHWFKPNDIEEKYYDCQYMACMDHNLTVSNEPPCGGFFTSCHMPSDADLTTIPEL